MFRLLMLALLAGANAVCAATIGDAHSRFIEADNFKTLTEYLTGKASDGNRAVVRSQPAERTGEYFILTLDPSLTGFPASAEAVLEVIPSNAKEARVFRFSLSEIDRGNTYLYLGLTGSDWPGDEIRPLAWQVRIEQDETVLAEWSSFLWEMP